MKTDVSLSVNNLTDFDLYRRAASGAGLPEELPFVEILWDNYAHLDPRDLAAMLACFSGRISLHVMWSRFLERSDDEFEARMAHLRRHVEVLRPIRISDHLCRFRSGGLNLITPVETSYAEAELDRVCRRVDRYRNLVGAPFLIENYASEDPGGRGQLEFVARIVERTGCGVLFDVSNAVVAQLNGVAALSEWLDFLDGRTIHCHVGSYEYSPGADRYLDTHGADQTAEVEAALRAVAARAHVASVCYEREYGRSTESMVADLRRIHGALESAA